MFKKNYGSERVNILAGRQVFHDLSGAMRSNDEQKFMDYLKLYRDCMKKWKICKSFDQSIPQKLYCALLIGYAHFLALKEEDPKTLAEECSVLIMGIFKNFVLMDNFRDFSVQLLKSGKLYEGNPSSRDNMFYHGSKECSDYGSEEYYEFVYLWLIGKDLDYALNDKFDSIING